MLASDNYMVEHGDCEGDDNDVASGDVDDWKWWWSSSA